MPSSSTQTVSPGTIGPTPAGVPVSTTSPGSRVMTWDMNASTVPTSWISWLVRPSCLSTPLTPALTRRSAGSRTVSIHGPMGQYES